MLAHATLPQCNTFSLPGMCFPFLFLCKVSSWESWLRQHFSEAFPSCPRTTVPLPDCSSGLLPALVLLLPHLEAPPGLHLHLISSTRPSIWRVADGTRLSLTTKLPPTLLEGWTEGLLALLTHFWRCLGLKGWQRQTVSLKYSNSHLHPEKGRPNYTSCYSVTLNKNKKFTWTKQVSGPAPTQKPQLWLLRDAWKSKLPPQETALTGAGCSHPGPWAQV